MTRIKTELEYQAILSRIEELVEIVDDTMSMENQNMIELSVLTDLVVEYEKQHFPVAVPTLIEVMKLRMYEMDLTQVALAELLEVSKSRVSQYLNGNSEPTLQVGRRISKVLNIDPAIVLGVDHSKVEKVTVENE